MPKIYKKSLRNLKSLNVSGTEFDPAPPKRILQAFAFSFWFMNANPSVASVSSVANFFLLFFFLFSHREGSQLRMDGPRRLQFALKKINLIDPERSNGYIPAILDGLS